MQELKNISVFRGFSDAELSALSRCLKEVTFEKGQPLFIEGSFCDRIFFLKSGRAKLSRISSSGREQILETLDSGGTCACNPGVTPWHCTTTAVALTRCVVWFLSKENYVKLVHGNAKLSRALNQLFAEKIQGFSALIEEISLKDSQKRLAKFLLNTMRRNHGKLELVLDLTREEMAQRMGTARETIGRQLYKLRDKKLISIKRRQIVIRDKIGLEKLV